MKLRKIPLEYRCNTSNCCTKIGLVLFRATVRRTKELLYVIQGVAHVARAVYAFFVMQKVACNLSITYHATSRHIVRCCMQLCMMKREHKYTFIRHPSIVLSTYSSAKVLCGSPSTSRGRGKTDVSVSFHWAKLSVCCGFPCQHLAEN